VAQRRPGDRAGDRHRDLERAGGCRGGRFELLGALLEAVTGEPCAPWLEREVLPRFGLRRTSIQRAGQAMTATATGYRVVGTRLAAAAPRVSPHPAGGGMAADLDDLAALAAVLAIGTDPLAVAAAARVDAGPGPARFAPGYALLDRLDGPLAWRGGGVPGCTAEIRARPGTGTATALVATESPPDEAHALAVELMEIARTSRGLRRTRR
jgi:CubicO group peptidase (beta-lactamase class C family)